MGSRARRAVLATLAFGAWCTHVLVMALVHGAPAVEVLWMCHVAPLLLALGCAIGSVPLASVGTTWLSAGMPLWLGDIVATGGRVEPTPALVHIGTLAVGIAAARTLGWDRAAWWRASLALAALAVITRLVPGAERDDINLVFRVWPGWERFFPDHARFLAFVVLSTPPVFFLIGSVLSRLAKDEDRPTRGRDRRSRRRLTRAPL